MFGYAIVRLGYICDVLVGGEPPTDCIKSEVSDTDHPYAVWGNGKDVYGYSGTYSVQDDSVCISSIGANTGSVFFHKGPFTPIIRLKVLSPSIRGVNIRYLFHVVSTIEFAPKKSSVPNMSSNDIKKAIVCLPDLEKQEKIAIVLDHFYSLCYDLSSGLPAEIAAHQKQYEYYRDKLLSFKE